MDSMIRDINLATSGHAKIDWVIDRMPVLSRMMEDLAKKQTLAGDKIVMTIHLEAKTAFLALVLKSAGAEVVVTGSNPLSTQDDVAAALVERGVKVYAWHNCSSDEYDEFLHRALDIKPNIIIDDGGDLVSLLQGARADLASGVWGGAEETTTGVHRLKALQANNSLPFPMLAVNDAKCKHMFDNRYGTGQSTWESIMRNTNLSIAGKTVVVAGYGWCGKGVAMRAQGLAANVIICEVDPVRAVEAVFDGYRVMPMFEAAKIGDIFVTVTGCSNVINGLHYSVMKDGAILSNAGHFDVEVNKTDLYDLAIEKNIVRNSVEQFVMSDGRKLYLLGEGRLVNLAAGDGHPAEIMDLSFALQTMAVLYIKENHKLLEKKVYDLPSSVDEKVATYKLAAMGITHDKLTEQQESYLNAH